MPARPAVHEARVVENTELAPGIILLTFEAPALATAAAPGQFVMIVPPGGERAATALGIYEASGKRMRVLFLVCGSRTRELARLREDDRVAIAGPLGNGFLLDDARDVAIVAGGLGIASVLLAAENLIAAGSRVRMFYGARSAQMLVERERFAKMACELVCATDDGSFGKRAFVTELLAAVEAKPDLILACGPSPMLRATAVVAKELGVPAQLSLEEPFGCGFGACWGCVIPLDGKSAQAPPFPGADRGGSDVVYARTCK